MSVRALLLVLLGRDRAILDYSLLPAPGLPSPNGQEATIETRDIQVLLPGSLLHGEVDFVVTPVEFVNFLRGSDGPWRLDSM